MLINVAGIDPALSNFGLAKGTFDTDTNLFTPTGVKLVTTEGRKGKQVRQNSDDLRRSQELCRGVQEWITGTHICFAEIPTGSQSARGSFSNGVSLGVLASIGSTPGYKGRLIQVLPHEVKLAVTDSKHATKEEMIEWATTTYPHLNYIRGTQGKFKGQVLACNEHIADALATIEAGILTDEFTNLRQALVNYATAV